MRLLIRSVRGDLHAAAVADAAARVGHSVVIWCGPADAGEITASFGLMGSRRYLTAGQPLIGLDNFDLVWNRRNRLPRLPNVLHPADTEFAAKENTKFWGAILEANTRSSRWLNDPVSAARSENKPLQLRLASELGLLFPDTLISNDVDQIVDFIMRNCSVGKETVYKTFRSASWRENGTFRVKHTVTIDAESLLNNTTVALVPGIYQTRLMKAFEVRANFFGDNVICVKIDSQRDEVGQVDWRSLILLDGYLSAISIPKEVERKCRSLMAALGIDMACFDFVVDLDGNYYFLELNQQGQFLWVEQAVPQCELLSAFLNFMEAMVGSEGATSHVHLGEVVAGERFSSIMEQMNQHGYCEVGP